MNKDNYLHSYKRNKLINKAKSKLKITERT